MWELDVRYGHHKWSNVIKVEKLTSSKTKRDGIV